VEAELPTQEMQNLVIEQLQNSFNMGRIKEILKHYDSHFDQWTLAVAMDHVQKLPVDQRRASDPDTKEVKQRLSALYMHLLPEMDPCRSVKLLQTLAQLGVCMHEPGKNQEGFTAVNRHMSQVSEVLLKMDNDQDVINMLWALAKHSHHRELAVDEDLFRYMAQYLVTKVPSLQFRMLSKTAQAYALVGINEWSLLDSICAAAFAKLQSGEFDPAPTINLLDALSKLRMENDSFLAIASLKLKANVAALTPSNLATVAKALAEMRYDDETMWRRLMEQATRRMSILNPSQVVSFTWALSKRGIADVPMHASLAGRSQAILDKFNASELASLVYLLGKQGLEPKSLMPSLVERATALMGSMSLRNVSNLVRGFQLLDYGAATLTDQQQPEGGEPDPAAQLYTMAAQRAKEWLKDPEGRLVLSLQGTSEEYLDEEMRRVERSKDEHTADIIERVHYKSGNVVETRLYHVSKKHFKSQNLSDIALALADRGAADPELFSYIAVRAKETMRSFTLMSMVDLVCGFAQAGYYDKETFDELERQFGATFSEMGPAYLADTMWAFATLKHPLNSDLLKAVMDSSWSRWHRMCSDQQVLARLMWALYTLNADALQPDHAVFTEFQRLLEEQEGQTEVADAGSGSPEQAGSTPSGQSS